MISKSYSSAEIFSINNENVCLESRIFVLGSVNLPVRQSHLVDKGLVILCQGWLCLKVDQIYVLAKLFCLILPDAESVFHILFFFMLQIGSTIFPFVYMLNYLCSFSLSWGIVLLHKSKIV